jgi:hypothetical protein
MQRRMTAQNVASGRTRAANVRSAVGEAANSGYRETQRGDVRICTQITERS